MPVKKNLRYCTLLPLLLCMQAVFAQEDLEKDTIQVSEVLVSKKGKKVKLKTLQLDGPCYYPENMHNAEEIITLVDKLPQGILESVGFYFNDLYSKKEQSEKFRDSRFELVFYTADENNMPVSRIVHEPLNITVPRTFSGLMNIDVSGLVLDSPGKLFVGMKRLTPAETDNEFVIDCVCSGLDKYVTMVRKDASSAWERRWQCAALKAMVSVAVSR